MSYDYLFRVALIGDSASGKEDLIDFNKKHIVSTFKLDTKLTIGVSFHTKTVKYQGKTYKLQLYDISDKEHYKHIIPRYLRGIHCALILYNVGNAQTLDKLSEWVNIIRQAAGETIIILVGNQQSSDMPRKISKEEGIELVNKFQLSKYVEISTDTGEGIEKLFEQLTELLAENYTCR